MLKELLKKIPGFMVVRSFQLAFNAPLFTIIDSHRKIGKYKGKYMGKRCFIVGNGPSLTPDDLNLIKNEISFAANTIYKIFPKTDWRPTFYCVQDNNVLKEIASEGIAENTFRNCEASFVRMYSNRIIRRAGMELNNLIYIPIVDKKTPRYSAPFSGRADRFVFDGSMVTYLALQLAVFMGFKEIYLIGMDHNFPYSYDREGKLITNNLNNAVHFWESANENRDQSRILLHANYQEFAENSYREAKKYCEKDGTITIYNATRGGKLEVFERVNLEKVISGGD